MNELSEEVWKHSTPLDGLNPDIWRKDFAGALIRRDQYGVSCKYGWVIDHIKPKSLGGDDTLYNLQALHWRNNAAKGNNYPEFESCITSNGKDNIYKERRWRLNTKK